MITNLGPTPQPDPSFWGLVPLIIIIITTCLTQVLLVFNHFKSNLWFFFKSNNFFKKN